MEWPLFSGAYTLLGGSGGMLDSGLLLVTYVYQVAFYGGSGRFDLPGAASMSLLVAPLLGGMLFILLKTKTFSLGHDEVYLLSYYCNLSCNEHLSICLDVFFLFQDESGNLSTHSTTTLKILMGAAYSKLWAGDFWILVPAFYSLSRSLPSNQFWLPSYRHLLVFYWRNIAFAEKER